MTALQLVINGLLTGGTYLLMAMGLSLIFGVMKVVNFAHGAMMVFSGLLVFDLSQAAGLNVVLAVVIGVVSMALLGLLTQWVIIERVRGAGQQGELQSLVVTYGLSLVLVNGAVVLFGSQYMSLPSLQGSWSLGSITLARGTVVGGAVAITASLAVFWWLRMTHYGKLVIATSSNSIGAAACGVNPSAVRRVAFSVGAAMAAAAGGMLILETPLTPQSALDLTVLSFVVIAIGGLGSYRGAVVGAAALGLGESLVGYYLGGVLQSLVPYAFLLLVLLVRAEVSFRGH